MSDAGTQHAFSPTVLRERADRLTDLTSNGTPHMDGTSTVAWPKYADRPGQVNVVVPGHVADDLRSTAASDRLLADLLDAIGPTEYLPYKVRDLREGRATSSTANWIERIDAVLEAHHD